MAARISRNGARRLMSSISSHAASGVFSTVPFAMMPAAFTSVVSPPKAWTACATIAAGASAAVTSASNTAHRPPAPSTSCATSASADALRPTASTAAPSRPKRAAVARPMPLEAPVMTAICMAGL